MHSLSKRSSTEDQKTPADKAREHLDSLRAAEPALIRVYDDATLAAVDSGDKRAADTAYATLAAHRESMTRASDALQAIERRERRQHVDAAARVIDDAWATAAGHAERRVAAAQRLEADFERLGKSWAVFAACTTDMHVAIHPSIPTYRREALGIFTGWLADVFKLECGRASLPGGTPLEGRTPKPLTQLCREVLQRIGDARTSSKQEAA